MLPAGVVVGARLGGRSGQQGGRQSDWDCKVSWTIQACNAAVTYLLQPWECSQVRPKLFG